MDVVVPIVFPDYLIAVATPEITLEVPDVLPWIDVLPPNLKVKKSSRKLPMLGHAGVLFFNGQSGLTKYYEYGRYDPANLGLVRRVPVPDVVIGQNKRPTAASLKQALHTIARTSGQRGRIHGVYIEVEGKFQAMFDYAEGRKKQNGNPKRPPYDLLTNSCLHFAKGVAEAAGVATPWMVDPRPNSYIGEFRADFPDLDYDPSTKKLRVEGVPELGDAAR
jgi:hypothetical protein